MQRLFISANCDDKVKARFLSVQEMIKAQSVKGSFTRPENLHLTLVFLGETPEDEIPLISSVIDKALNPPVTPFSLAFSTIGCFKHSNKGLTPFGSSLVRSCPCKHGRDLTPFVNKELWWIGTEHNDKYLDILKTIRQRIAENLLSEGVNFDNRPFNPHITLGREIKHTSPIIIPQQEIIFPVNRISLMKSERVSGILTYTEISGLNLAG